MKTAAFLSALLALSASAAPITWQDLSTGDRVVLDQPLVLDAREGGKIRVAPGAPYVLDSITPLPGLSVVDLVFSPKVCRNPGYESVLTMVLPRGNSSNSRAEVGVYFLKDCALEVLVEAKDYGKPSFYRN